MVKSIIIEVESNEEGELCLSLDVEDFVEVLGMEERDDVQHVEAAIATRVIEFCEALAAEMEGHVEDYKEI
jgi:hypothetical protein